MFHSLLRHRPPTNLVAFFLFMFFLLSFASMIVVYFFTTTFLTHPWKNDVFHFCLLFLVVFWLWFLFCKMLCLFVISGVFLSLLRRFVAVCRVYSTQHPVIFVLLLLPRCLFLCRSLLLFLLILHFFQSSPPFVSCVSVSLLCVFILLLLGVLSLVSGYWCRMRLANNKKFSLSAVSKGFYQEIVFLLHRLICNDVFLKILNFTSFSALPCGAVEIWTPFFVRSAVRPSIITKKAKTCRTVFYSLKSCFFPVF